MGGVLFADRLVSCSVEPLCYGVLRRVKGVLAQSFNGSLSVGVAVKRETSAVHNQFVTGMNRRLGIKAIPNQ